MESKVTDNCNEKEITENGEAPEKVAKIETEDASSNKASLVRRRSKKAEEDLIAEARAMTGVDIDSSEGRRLRKRSDPLPKEEKKKATPKRTYTKKKADEPEAAAENGDESKTSIVEDAEDKNNDEVNSAAVAVPAPTSQDEADKAPATHEHVAEENGIAESAVESGEAKAVSSESIGHTNDDQGAEKTE